MSQTKAQLIEGLNINTSAPADALVIDSSGNVGIGATPGVLVDAAGSNPTLRVRATTINTEVSTLRLTEDNSFVGAFVKYDGSTNLTHIGTHSAADSNTANDNNAITIVRDNRDVGIGTTSPTTKLHVQQSAVTNAPSRQAALYLENNANCEIQFVGNASNDCQLRFGTTSNSFKGAIEYELDNNNLKAYTNGSERLRLDSSGRLLVGTSTSLGMGEVQIPDTFLYRQGNASSTGHNVGVLKFGDNRPGEYAQIRAEADGTPGANDFPGRLLFSTTADGASTPTERMRITNDGRVGIGATNPDSNSLLSVNGVINLPDDVAIAWGGGTNRSSWSGNKSSGFLRAYTNGSERMRIDSSGKVGIGTTSPADEFHINSSSANVNLRLTRDTNTGARISGSDSTNPAFIVETIASGTATERMRINSSGRLLLGTTTVYTPSGGGSTPVTVVDGGNHRANLVISNQTNHADAGAAVVLAAHGQDWQLEATSVLKGNRDFTIKAGTNERLRLDNSGRFLYGTSTGVNLNNASGASAREAKAYIYNTASTTSERYNLGLITGNNGVAGPTVFLSKTRASSNTHTVVQSGDEVGDIRFSGSDGTFFVESARIRAKVDGTPGSQDMPGRLEFHTTADGASSTTERMRIDSVGNVGIGISDPGSKLEVKGVGDLSGTPYEYTYSTDGSIKVTGNESTVDIVSTDSGNHASSLILRGVNKGYGFSNDSGNDLFRLVSFTASANDWNIHESNGANVSSFVRLVSFRKSGGMCFGTDTAAANALDDYEVGTFTPTLAQGVTSPGYTNVGGTYIKIGDCVTFTLRMRVSSGTNNSAQVLIGGLPFTSSSSAREGGAFFNYRHDLNSSSAGPFMHIGQSSSQITFYNNIGGSWIGTNGSGIVNRTLHIQGHYYV